jgi:hypothetical protein
VITGFRALLAALAKSGVPDFAKSQLAQVGNIRLGRAPE